MSESTPSSAVENAPVGRPEALTPEVIEAVLADFRTWLQDAATRQPSAASPPLQGQEARTDLSTLLAQFTALRHEVHLQTRASRSQQEQNAETIRELHSAVAGLREKSASSAAQDESAAEAAVRALLTTLIEVADALNLADREVQRLKAVISSRLKEFASSRASVSVSEDEEEEDFPLPFPEQPPRSLLARLFGFEKAMIAQYELIAALHEELVKAKEGKRDGGRPLRRERRRLARSVQQLFDSMLTGYTMSRQRIERALQQHGLEAISTSGERFDPEKMEVIETVSGSGRPVGEVVDEVRRGYLWRGRVFRFAQVRVARS